MGPFISTVGARVVPGAIALASILAALAGAARADEGGVSFWIPGTYASLAAVPSTPGWSASNIVLFNPGQAGRGEVFPRGGQLEVDLEGSGVLDLFGPTYTWADPVLGGQLSIGVLAVFGRVDATVSGTLTGPGGNTISGARSDTTIGFGDLYPQVTLKWNDEVSNYMGYLTGDIPVGSYDPDRLANIGIGHGAIDGGAGYTYMDTATGHEFSVVGGLTYNFENPDTNYQNGIDYHIDWGASQFLSENFFVGPAGYFYGQLTGDSGSGDLFGPFESSSIGLGGQVGYIFPVGNDLQGFLGLKANSDLYARDRLDSWSTWLTFNLSAAPPAKSN